MHQSLFLHFASLLVLMVTAAGNLAFASSSPHPQDGDSPTWGESQGNDLPLLDPQQEREVDAAQDLVSNELLWAAQWIDSFFDDGRATAEENSTRATLALGIGYSRNDAFEIKPRFDLRLRLPQLSSRLNLFISAAEDKDFIADSDPISSRPAHSDADKRETTAGLRYFLAESRNYNISFDSGASWDYLFAGLRYRHLQEFSIWRGRFTNQLRYYTDDGVKNITSYDLERELGSKLLFRATTSVNLYEDEDGIPHAQHFRLYQVLSPLQALSYEIGLYGDTQPSYKMTDSQAIMRYRQRFFRDWLMLEISPRLTFPEEDNRQANPGIVAKLEATFGYQAGEGGYRKIFR
jgi:hypothetical protein